jgi:hypothetical protein
MAPTPTLQTLAFHARDVLPKDSSPEDGAVRTFEVVVDTYARALERAAEVGLQTHATASVLRIVTSGQSASPDLERRIERFVLGTICYLASQYLTVKELKRDRWMLSRLFCAHLREALRIVAADETGRLRESVTLREYMSSRPGEYLIAETRTRVEVEQLDPQLADLVVEEFVVRDDEWGRRTVHLHSATTHAHILTCVADPSTARQ